LSGGRAPIYEDRPTEVVKTSDPEVARKLLQDQLAKTTPFRIGENKGWLLIQPLVDDPPASIPDGTIHTHEWSFARSANETWLFLILELPDLNRKWAFAFDLGSVVHLRFLGEMIKTKRVHLLFPNKTGFVLDPNPAYSLVEGLKVAEKEGNNIDIFKDKLRFS
jgi:hypothetical protein